MEKENLQNLTTKQLKKRRKFGSLAIILLIVAVVFAVVVLIYDVITGNGFDVSLFVPAAACFVILIPIYMGKKKIEEELNNREEESSEI